MEFAIDQPRPIDRNLGLEVPYRMPVKDEEKMELLLGKLLGSKYRSLKAMRLRRVSQANNSEIGLPAKHLIIYPGTGASSGARYQTVEPRFSSV